jgi:hypothetical protein
LKNQAQAEAKAEIDELKKKLKNVKGKKKSPQTDGKVAWMTGLFEKVNIKKQSNSSQMREKN